MFARVFAIIMALVFVVFAVLQYNDPDPYLWIPIYLYAALLSVLFYRGKVSTLLLWVSAAAFLAGAIYLWPAHWEGVALKQGMKTMNIEHGRESLGLGMCFVTLVIYALTLRRPVLAA
jgi:Transmembrane family 220, helix